MTPQQLEPPGAEVLQQNGIDMGKAIFKLVVGFVVLLVVWLFGYGYGSQNGDISKCIDSTKGKIVQCISPSGEPAADTSATPAPSAGK